MKLVEGTGSKAYFLYSLICFVLYYLFFQNNELGNGLRTIASLLLIWGVVSLAREARDHKLSRVYRLNILSKLKRSNEKQKLVVTVWIIVSIWWGISIANRSYDSSAAFVDIPFLFVVFLA